MQRPGFLGDVSDSWFGDDEGGKNRRKRRKRRPLIPKPKLPKLPTPKPAKPTKPTKPTKPAKPVKPQKPTKPRYDMDLPVVSPKESVEPMPMPEPKAAPEISEVATSKLPAQAPVTPTQQDPNQNAALAQAQQALYSGMVMVPGVGPVPVAQLTPQQAAALQVAQQAQAQAQAQAKAAPGVVMPMMMAQQQMGPRPQIIRPSGPQQIRKPVITPQMERIGKIAAAIGAGLFFL